MSVREILIQEIAKNFKALPPSVTEPLFSENLISPFHLELPKKILLQAQNFVQACFQMRESPDYLARFTHDIQLRGLIDPGNKSILMSYDFHLDAEENLKLIEVNTNAAFLAVADSLYRAVKIPQPVSDFKISEIKDNILQELRLHGKNTAKPKIAIIDDNPQSQRLYVEFLLFNELFKSWGFDSGIFDYRETPLDADFVYNRTTDFYFEDASYKQLRENFLNKKICFSPNPFEYFVLADKQRMIDWQTDYNLARPEMQSCLLKSMDLNTSTADEIWSQRKKFFFKPKQAFGSKQTYRGESISRKYFDEILDKNFIAQEFAPAPEKNFETPQGVQSYKYDLRFYAYQGRVQSAIARLYQGQVTNSKTPYGGFACVQFT